MLKKLFAVLLVAVMLFSFAACRGSVKDGADAAADALLSKNIEKKDILGVWESEAKISDIFTYTNEDQLDNSADTGSNMLEVFKQVESDETFDVSIQFNDDNTYDIIYETDSFIDAIKDYYDDVFEVLKKDKELLKKFLGADDATLDLIISSNGFSSFEQVVDLLAQNIDNMNESDLLSTLTSSFTGSTLENDNLVLKGLKYEIDGKNLKVQLDKSSEETADMILKNGKLSFKTFDGLSKSANAIVFKNGFEKADND